MFTAVFRDFGTIHDAMTLMIRTTNSSGSTSAVGLVRFCYLLKSVGVDLLRFLFCNAATAFII